MTLGKISKREADAFSVNIERLCDIRKHGSTNVPGDLQSWLEHRCERHLEQLSRVGLVDYLSSNLTLSDLFDAYETWYLRRTEIADSTKKKVTSTLKNRVGRLRGHKIKDVEPSRISFRKNADPVWSENAESILTQFNSWQRNYASVATWSRDNKLLSSIGIWAVAQGYCDYNPFSTLPSKSMVNDERNEYIDAQKVLDAMEACLSPDIRLTLAMGRFAGVRTCSEVRTLKWSHVDFETGILTVIDSKKKKARSMPMFDDIRDELIRQREFTGSTRFVASEEMRSSTASANYTKVKNAVSRSGQEPWERLRQNLRTSCENDLLERFEEREVTSWLGHSVAVSRDHYQKTRPGDFKIAIEKMREISDP